MIALPLEAIKIGPRFRQDLGDIGVLARSIKAVGLLHPIVVTPENDLVCGQRRIDAARRLGWQDIPAHIVSLDEIICGEQAENEVRKDFTLSERVEIGGAIEEKFGERRGRPWEIVEKIPHLISGEKTRDLVAQKTGFGNGKT